MARASLGFSPDGAHLSFIAGHSDPLFIFDNRLVGTADDLLGPAYDSAGAGVAWAVRDGLRWRLYARYPGRLIDRQPDEVPLSLLFSPDGRHLAATMRKPLGTTLVLLDDSIIAEHDAAKGLCFSADGSNLAWLEQVKGGWRVVSGGRTGARYANAWFLTLSPDGKHYACVTGSRRGYSVVLDGEVVGRYDDLVSGFVFESAGELRFIARRRGRYLLVVTAVPAGPGN